MSGAAVVNAARVGAPVPPSAESLCLPRDYRQQTSNLTLDANRDDGSYWSDWRIKESARWQHHDNCTSGRATPQ